jgi:hypothetical protein
MLAHRVSHEGINITETLSNLTYLIRLDAENPSLVRSYADEAEGQLLALAALLRSVVQETNAI